MQVAIITGASSGLGKVFFEKIAERYPQLDEYWVIARSENKLKELAERGTITYIAKRLQRIQKDLQRQGGSKAKLTFEDALKQVLEMANKYNTYYRESQHAEEESAAVIILSESFQNS